MTERVERIHPHVMKTLGEQLRHTPQPHSLGIGAARGWLVVQLADGRYAVGSFGGGLVGSAEDVAKHIRDFQGLKVDVPTLGCIGL